MKNIFHTILVFAALNSFGQMQIALDIFEKKSGEPIEEAHVILLSKGDTLYQSVDYNGEEIFFPKEIYSSLNVKVSADFHHDVDTLIYFTNDDLNRMRRKTIQVEIGLRFDGQITDEYTVDGVYKPTVVFGSEVFSVADFEIDFSGNLFAIIYPKTIKKSAYIVKIEEGEIVKRYRIPFLPEQMTIDYAGKIYVLGNDSFWRLTYKQGDIQIESSDRAWFDKQIEPIIDTFENHVFYTTYVEHYPAFECMRVSTNDSIYKELYYIEDEEMMEHYRAEYKYADVRTKLWAWDMERETNIDREVWVGANNFTQSIYYEPPYAPVFLKQDTLLVFDHYKDHLFKIDVKHEKICDSVPISYHRPWRNDWSNRIIQDPITKEIYILFDKAGYSFLKRINPHTGKLDFEFPLHYRYVEKIRVINGWVHYIYRPFESIQKKYLYKEEIKEK
jgi:hypothetical protein